MTQRIKNFSLLNATTTILSATDTSQSIALTNRSSDDLMIINTSTATVFVRTGDSTVEADANAMPILPGEKGVYSKGLTGGRTTTLAYFATIGTVQFSVIQGQGS